MDRSAQPASAVHVELEAAHAAFERGDVRSVRKIATRILASDAPELAKAEASTLLGRTGMEPMAAAALAGMVVVITGIITALVLRA